MRNFFKGILIGIAGICALALLWLFVFQPELTRYEAKSLKDAFEQSGLGASSTGAVLHSPPEIGDSQLLDFTSLQTCHPDIKAWLAIRDTPIDYPVLQSSIADPEHYLRRNYTGEYRVAGSLFLQADCTLDGQCLVIYGHNMNDGTMFGTLPMYTNPVFFREHSQIVLQTPDGTRVYRVAAVLETDVNRVPFNRANFFSDVDFLGYVQCIRDEAMISADSVISTDSQLLVLVTCSYTWANARYVVVAVRN